MLTIALLVVAALLSGEYFMGLRKKNKKLVQRWSTLRERGVGGSQGGEGECLFEWS